MKRILTITLLLFLCCNTGKAQWMVHDAMGEITSIMNSLEEVAVSSDNLGAALRNVEKNTKMLDLAVNNVKKLRQVSSKIKNGKKAIAILTISVQTGELYTRIAKALINSQFSQISKARHLANLYNMLAYSTAYAIDLENIITDNVFEMNDAERIRFINEIYDKAQRNYCNMSYYGKRLTEDNYFRLSLQEDMNRLSKLY